MRCYPQKYSLNRGSLELIQPCSKRADGRTVLRPMRPYQTRIGRFAAKIREAILDLRRPQSALTRVVRRGGRALSTPLLGQLAFFSPILLAPEVGAMALEQPTKIQISTLSYDYWFKVLHAVRTNIPSVSSSSGNSIEQLLLTLKSSWLIPTSRSFLKHH